MMISKITEIETIENLHTFVQTVPTEMDYCGRVYFVQPANKKQFNINTLFWQFEQLKKKYNTEQDPKKYHTIHQITTELLKKSDPKKASNLSKHQPLEKIIAFIRFFFWSNLSTTARGLKASLNGVQRVVSRWRKGTQYNSPKVQYLYASCLEKGYLTNKDESKAFQIYQAAAEAGYLQAQLRLARYHEDGGLMYPSEQLAFSWYEKAANGGSLEAKRKVAECYMQGVGVTKDVNRGIALLEECSKEGDLRAQNLLSAHHLTGTNVEENYEKAFFWTEKGAEKGDPDALCNLGIFYDQGIGIKKDRIKASKLIEDAAKKGNANAQYRLANSYHYGDINEVDSKKAVTWYEKAVAQGHLKAKVELSNLLRTNSKNPQAMKRAFDLMEEAAHEDDAEAQYKLGSFYCHGLGCTKSTPIAICWLERSAEKGNSNAQIKLYQTYINYNECFTTDKEVLKWLLLSIINGNEEGVDELNSTNNSAKKLFLIELQGELFTSLYSHYLGEASKGNPEAMYRLSLFYKIDCLIGKDNVAAMVWLEVAARAGFPEAQYQLSRRTDLYGEKEGLLWNKRAALNGHPQAMRIYGLYLLIGFSKRAHDGFKWIEGNHAQSPDGCKFYEGFSWLKEARAQRDNLAKAALKGFSREYKKFSGTPLKLEGFPQASINPFIGFDLH